MVILLRLRESLARRRDLDDVRLFSGRVGGGHFAFPREPAWIRRFWVHEPRLCIRTGRGITLLPRGSLGEPAATTGLVLVSVTSACGLEVSVTRPEWTPSVRGA